MWAIQLLCLKERSKNPHGTEIQRLFSSIPVQMLFQLSCSFLGEVGSVSSRKDVSVRKGSWVGGIGRWGGPLGRLSPVWVSWEGKRSLVHMRAQQGEDLWDLLAEESQWLGF